MCHEAYIFNAESSIRIEKSNNHGSMPPEMLKMRKHIFVLNLFCKSMKYINARFSAFNNFDFWVRQIIITKSRVLNFEMFFFFKLMKLDYIKRKQIKNIKSKTENGIRKALRVPSAETRLTVYRRPRVRPTDRSRMQNLSIRFENRPCPEIRNAFFMLIL